MDSILALMPIVLLIVLFFYLFKISWVLTSAIILAVPVIIAIKLIITYARRTKTIKERSCYKCGAKMVLKTAESGKYKGKKFYGCSSYPDCDCVIDINGRPVSLLYRKYRKARKQSVKKKYVPLCSRCGAEMVLRTAKQGPYKGKQFYGCSRYPKCKNIVNIN